MFNRMHAGAVARVSEQRRRRVLPGERRVVSHIGPGPRGVGLALRQHRHRRVVTVQPLRRQHMRRNQLVQRSQREGACTHLVGQRRDAERDNLPGVAFALAVQRLMLPVLLEHDGGEQVRTRPAARHHVIRRRGLGELLAVATGELLAHRLNHLPLARNHLQRLGQVFADPRQPLRPAARARRRRGTTTRSRGRCSGKGCETAAGAARIP